MNNRLDIDALQALLAVEAYGGVTRAAEKLNLTQPAVSHKIKRLETQLGTPLLARRGGAAVFTDEGCRLLGYAKRILDLHDEAIASIGQNPLNGTLRLGMSEDTSGGDLTRILGRFSRLHPNVQVQTKIGSTLNLLEWLEKGQIDLAITQVFEADVHPTDVILKQDKLHWIKSPDFPIALQSTIPFIAYDQSCIYRKWATEQAAETQHRLNTVVECPSTQGILTSVRAGLGVALMNAMHIDKSFQIIDDQLSPPPDIVYVVRTRRGAQSHALRALVKTISDEVSATLPKRVA